MTKFGLGVPNGGDFADPARLAALARDAEASPGQRLAAVEKQADQ